MLKMGHSHSRQEIRQRVKEILEEVFFSIFKCTASNTNINLINYFIVSSGKVPRYINRSLQQ